MADTISGHWSRPIVKTKGGSIALAVVFFGLSIVMWHDAYEVRGHDRPFLLKIVGLPQI
jgi:hypothetical protein